MRVFPGHLSCSVVVVLSAMIWSSSAAAQDHAALEEAGGARNGVSLGIYTVLSTPESSYGGLLGGLIGGLGGGSGLSFGAGLGENVRAELGLSIYSQSSTTTFEDPDQGTVESSGESIWLRPELSLIYLMPATPEARFFAGGRAAVATRLSHSDELDWGENYDNVLAIGPVVGGEYLFAGVMGIGFEGGLSLAVSDSVSGSSQSNSIGFGTNTRVMFRYYF